MAERTDRLVEITRQAAEIAALVPEHLQEAAFNRAFTELAVERGDAPRRPATRPGPRRASPDLPSTTNEDDLADRLMNAISRTDHPEIAAAPKALDRALFLLRAAQTEHDIDGMTAPQIAKVLTDKFRLRVSRQAINQALDNAGTYVDRTRTSHGVVYRLMQPGEKYLEDGPKEESRSRKKPASGASSRANAKSSRSRGRTSDTQSASTPSGKKRASKGPKALIEELIAERFFDTPRTIGEIQDRLRHKKGVQLKATDLSPALVRLLRQNVLDRERNDDNQYEYIVGA